jgi:hypothetical protein
LLDEEDELEMDPAMQQIIEEDLIATAEESYMFPLSQNSHISNNYNSNDFQFNISGALEVPKKENLNTHKQRKSLITIVIVD